jgi:hypothetical protein
MNFVGLQTWAAIKRVVRDTGQHWAAAPYVSPGAAKRLPLKRGVAPLGWNHIGLTGDYNWHANKRVAKGGFRPLRRVRSMESTVAAP